MIDKIKQLVIIGGGTSLSEGINKGLWQKLESKFTIGTNYSYRYFDSTILTFVDRKFYQDEKENLKSLSLIVGKGHKRLEIMPNTVILPCKSTYNRNLTDGIYKAGLVGLFALSLGIHLLDEGEIYLLGFDYGEARTKDYTKFVNYRELNEITIRDDKKRALTHFYQGEINHRGIGKISYYNEKGRANRDFGVYKNEKKVKIYNVSLISKIETFPKISYEEFFNRLDGKKYEQNQIINYIKNKLAKN